MALDQAAVELGRRDVGDHRARSRDLLAAGEADTGRLPVAYQHALDVAAGLAGAAVVLDQPHECIDEPSAAPARDRHPAFLNGDPDHLSHEARGSRVRPEPGVEHPRREQAACAFGDERLGQPVTAGDEHVARELDRPLPPEPPQALHPEAETVPRPQLGSEHAEGEVRRREERLDRAAPLLAQLGDVRLGRAQEKGRLAVRKERGCRVLRVQVLEPAGGELVAELGVSRAADPERMPGAEDVVQVAGLGDLGRADRTAELVLALQHAHAPAAACKQRRAGERVDAAADDDGVEINHRRAPGTRRR